MCWSVPAATHTIFAENLLGIGFNSLRINVLSQYVNFFQGLLVHNSREVALVANLVGRDLNSTTGRNLTGIRAETSLNPWSGASSQVKSTLKNQVKHDEKDNWRLFLLEKYLLERQEKIENLETTDEISQLIDSLCTT